MLTITNDHAPSVNLTFFAIMNYGEVSERFKVLPSKRSRSTSLVGSNPTLSAKVTSRRDAHAIVAGDLQNAPAV